ncbi:MAG TPA: ankyrin repeat domain-containing protein [Isosphaeraceae bacterium]|nr:ankyrin repeat domain-containing protein [Isosphaeraceae bacterium]
MPFLRNRRKLTIAITAVLLIMITGLGLLSVPGLPGVRVTVHETLTPVRADSLFIAISDGDVQKVVGAVKADPTLLRRWRFDDLGLLSQAARYHRHDLVTALLRMGADPNADHGTPLLCSVIDSQPATAIALLKAGADPYIKGPYENTAYSWAEDNQLTEVLQVMRGLPTTRPATTSNQLQISR